MKLMLASGSPVPVTHWVGTRSGNFSPAFFFKLFKNYFMNRLFRSLRDTTLLLHHFDMSQEEKQV